MKILIATGRLAENTVRKAAGEKADVLVADIDIAAFITPKKLVKAIQDAGFSSRHDLILLPGLVAGDFSKVSEELGCKIRLGPKHAYDLSFVLHFTEEVEFSEKVPACELLADVRKEMAFELVRKAEEQAHPSLTLGEVKLGGNSRMKVMGEIVGAAEMNPADLAIRIEAFIARGADIIDLGATLNTLPGQIRRAVSLAKTLTCTPISVDTLDPELIKEGIEAGAKLVLSLNGTNMETAGPIVAKAGVAAVVIPDEGNNLENLIKNIEAARRLGIEKIIADPVLDPVGHNITESIVRYHEFHKTYPELPLFFGAGNVTELMDVDTIGVNATLCGIGAEAGASILFTPEYSDKAQGSIRELKKASEMMQLCKIRESSPKDLGIDLLCIKEKRRRPDSPLPEKIIMARASKNWRVDPAGPIRIRIVPDRISGDGGLIVAEHEKTAVAGESAREVMDTLLELELVSRLDHAAYLGRELEKAELSLRFNRSYAQDDVF
ncbi:dihydropteroate synthase-related protein [Methanosarcina siciliae HI350]|uniref:Dihydropteroate synthase-related protein n=1 Tax=Methanosarcina siciliae HI350 TaxID=1434119 RepID=A0A0E3PHB7_9EURY|nr:dihydropteroate synthase-like protein [Methanosarcina siciliae]AKB33842.1 dihydropteroate synthase-related protein [Methanosarcina siciliae HI350]